MKKMIYGMAFLSMVCAAPMFSVDVMTPGVIKEPAVIEKTAPVTPEPVKDLPKDDVQKLDNFHEATDFVAPVDAE